MRLDFVERAACEAGGITMGQLFSERKMRKIAKVRAACAVIYRRRGMTYPQMAERLNYKDHTSAIYIHQRAAHWDMTCPIFRQILDAASGADAAQRLQFRSVRRNDG